MTFDDDIEWVRTVKAWTPAKTLKSEPCPSVNPQPKIGHWIVKGDKQEGYDIAGVKTWYIQIMCDECGFINTAIEGHIGQYHYCPNCGTKMTDIQKSCSNCRYWLLDKNDENRKCEYCFNMDEWAAESEE